MAKIIKSNINSSGSYKSHGNLSSKHHSSSTTRKEKLKGGGSRAVTDSINSTKTINETQNYATTRSTTITSTRKTRSEYFIPLLSMPFWFVIIFLIMAMGTFNVMMDNNGLGKWELKEEYEIDNVYTLSDLQDMQLDTPLTALNNHTLREVFEDNNMYLGVDRMVNEYAFSLNNPLTVIQNHYYYVNRIATLEIGYLPSNDQFGRLTLIPSVFNLLNTKQIIGYSSDIRQFTLTSRTEGLYFYGISGYDTIHTSNVYDIHILDLTLLGIDDLTVSQMDYWYLVYQDILDGSVNKETKAALGTIDYRNPQKIDDDIVYLDYYHMTYEQQEKLGLPALNNLTTISTVLVGGKYLDDNDVIKETPGIFPTLTKLITSVTDVIEWFSDNTTKLIRYVDKGYENITGEKLNDTWKRTKNVWSWLRDQFGIVGGAS